MAILNEVFGRRVEFPGGGHADILDRRPADHKPVSEDADKPPPPSQHTHPPPDEPTE